MSDLFSNLAALSLGSKVGVQPLVPPLFAPAPQLLYEATMQAFNDGLAETAENSVFSITPPMVASGTGTMEGEQLSDEAVTPEKHTVLSNLVPSDVLQSSNAIYSQDNPAEDDASHSSSMYRHLGKVDEASMLHPIQLQEATLPNTGNPEITPSSMLHEEQKYSAEKTFQAIPEDYETQYTSLEDHPATSAVDISHDQNLSTSVGKAVAPLPIQPVISVSIPSLSRDDLFERSVNSDDIPDMQSSSSVQSHKQSSKIPIHIERSKARDLDVSESFSHASRAKRRMTDGAQVEAAFQQVSGLDKPALKPLLDQRTVAMEREEPQSPSTASTPEGIAQSSQARPGVPADPEMFQTISPVQLFDTQDALHSSRMDSKLEAQWRESRK